MIKAKYFFAILCASIGQITLAQSKKMTPDVYDQWNQIEQVKMSENGAWILYHMQPEDQNKQLYLYSVDQQSQVQFDRAEQPQFDYGAKYLYTLIKPAKTHIDSLKRAKVKKKDWPSDTLFIFGLEQARWEKISDVKSFKTPDKFAGLIAFAINKEAQKKDSTSNNKYNKGDDLMVFNLETDSIWQFKNIKAYDWSPQHHNLLLQAYASDSTEQNKVLKFDAHTGSIDTLYHGKGDAYLQNISNHGNLCSYIIKPDSSDNRKYDLYLAWKGHAEKVFIDNIKGISQDWTISHNYKPWFSENEKRLYFGTTPIKPEADTMLLEDEKVDLEIWHYKDPLLYTQQNNKRAKEEKRAYVAMLDVKQNRRTLISSPGISESVLDEKHEGKFALIYNERPYQKYISWLGYSFKDVYLKDLETGGQTMIAEKIDDEPMMSPDEKFVYWYSRQDTSWMTYDIAGKQTFQVTHGGFYDEYNDRPMHPWNAGFMAWAEGDQAMYIYDHFDIWRVSPTNAYNPVNLTQGRAPGLRYRHIKIDKETKSYPLDTAVLVKKFNTHDKTSGYAMLDLKRATLTEKMSGPFRFGTRITGVKGNDNIVYTKESFDLFPDLILSNRSFSFQNKITNANPQQSEYAWGSIDLFEWKDRDTQRQALLVKPPNFDPNKKYPLIINFYERSSDRLYNHRAPYPHRSTINYSYWSNKGYVIFNPDITYEVGYPGQSCLDIVNSGVDALLAEGYIDQNKMGLQGHSWGGYQIAYIIAHTDRFACAEAGAPVVNMTSAYGGIRWGSGMSRMFQYERTQSRLGATLWENPERYIENSPLFDLENVNTPVLILHNDKDGAVPWYQGIEYFVGLRRLGKPAWMLNYKDEPHWPVKRQNRIDFNKRLEQFFDHFLMDAPQSEWLKSGVPAVESDYNDGLQYEGK